MAPVIICHVIERDLMCLCKLVLLVSDHHVYPKPILVQSFSIKMQRPQDPIGQRTLL